MEITDRHYWQTRWEKNQKGWDIGYASPPLKGIIDKWYSNNTRLLIPGAGNGYEAYYAYDQGFKNVDVLDIASYPLKDFAKKHPDFPKDQLIEANFFEHNGSYDLILEQTFFCALPPDMRLNYVEKMHSLLKENGILAGVLFDFPLKEEGPPFGGSFEEYQTLFSKHFKILKMERCQNSIPERQGSELFIKLLKL